MWGHPYDQGVNAIVITLLWGVGCSCVIFCSFTCSYFYSFSFFFTCSFTYFCTLFFSFFSSSCTRT